MFLAATSNNFHLALIIAIIMFCVAGVLRFIAKSFDGALVAFGLAVVALAFIINS